MIYAPEDLWRCELRLGIERLLSTKAMKNAISGEHVKETPVRYQKALEEIFAGIHQKPEDALSTLFPADNYDEMIHEKEITFFSTCAHHLVPFFGKIHFAYIPDKNVVGLSKIPRLIEVYAKRPQVQEKLTLDIIDAFQNIVNPKGCAIMIRGYHMCMMMRGIKQPTAYTETTALRGCMRLGATKAEFLASANASNWRVF